MRRGLAVAIPVLLLALSSSGQVLRGTPASVTSLGGNRSFVGGVPASVTSIAPTFPVGIPRSFPGGVVSPCTPGQLIPSALGCTNPSFAATTVGLQRQADFNRRFRNFGDRIDGRFDRRFSGRAGGRSDRRFGGVGFNQGFAGGIIPVILPYAYPYQGYDQGYDAVYDPNVVHDPNAPYGVEVMDPRIQGPVQIEIRILDDRRNGSDRDRTGSDEEILVRNYQDLPEEEFSTAAEQALPAAEPQPEQEVIPTVLIFRDGRRQEVRNYAIMGKVLYDLETMASKRIELAELDLTATVKENEERGVGFALPRGISKK